jgi:hypothetical protein
MGDPAKALVIDCHAQLGEGETWAEPKRPVDYKVEMVLEHTAEAGIDRSYVGAPKNPSYQQANIRVARLCEKYPDKLIGYAVHNPQSETGRLRAMLTEEVKSMGLKGLKTDGHPTREILDVVAELGIPVIYYPVPDSSTALVRMYHYMAAAYPSVNFILPHLGRYRSAGYTYPYYDKPEASCGWWVHVQAIDLAKRHPNIHLEASGLDATRFLEMAAQELPAERIVFGSYAPEHDPRVELYAFKLLKLPPEQKAKLLGGNMQRLLHMGDSRVG